MDILDMRIFARVAALQNLSTVATEMGLTPGTISKRLQAMETELSVRLFDRTTRSIRITAEGETFLAHVERIMHELELAYAAVGDAVHNPRGKIALSAPVSLGYRYIMPAVMAFIQEFPEIDVQIDLSDQIVNLQEGGYDLAIRTGELTNSTLIAKRLASDRQVIAASRDYLKNRKTPLVPSDLTAHNCLLFNDTTHWEFQKNGDSHSVHVSGQLRSNNSELLHQAALEGKGLLCASHLQLKDDLSRGRLVQVLGEYVPVSGAAIWAIYPSTRHTLPKLRVFLDFLSDWFQVRTRDMSMSGGTAPIKLVAAAQINRHDDGKRQANR